MKGIVACVSGATALAVTGLVGAQVTAKPTLDVVGSRPLQVRGQGFKANERVVIVLHAANRPWTRAIEATDAGSFTARFPISVPRCRGFSLHAFGSRGSRAHHLSRLQLSCRPVSPDTTGIDPRT